MLLSVVANYEFLMKARLANFFKETNIRNVPCNATDAQAATILLALVNVFNKEETKELSDRIVKGLGLLETH